MKFAGIVLCVFAVAVAWAAEPSQPAATKAAPRAPSAQSARPAIPPATMTLPEGVTSLDDYLLDHCVNCHWSHGPLPPGIAKSMSAPGR